MQKCYYRIVWENYPSDKTPLNEQNLNKIDFATDEIDNRIISLDSAKFDKSEAQLLVKYIEYDEDTGIFTITHYNGASYTIDTLLEKLAINFDYDYQTQRLIIELSDGEIKYVDLSSLITQYEFLNSDTVAFTVDIDGKVTAKIIDGSIQEKHLRPDYLADIKVEVAKTALNAESAENSAKKAESYAHGDTGIREGENTDNAEYYYAQSKEIYENFQKSGNVVSVNGKTGVVNLAKTDLDLGNVANERQYSASNPQPSVTGSSGSCTGNSATATKLKTSRTIDGVAFDGSEDIMHFGVCETGAATVEKEVSISGFKLKTGARVIVKFDNGNSVATPTLNVNKTGAKDIIRPDGDGNIVSLDKYEIEKNGLYEFIYNGMYWQTGIVAGLHHPGFTSNDTTDSAATSWTSVAKLTSGESFKSILNKISTMFKNVRYLYNQFKLLKDGMESLYSLKRYSIPVSIAANSIVNKEITLDTVSGFTPVMAQLLTTSSSNTYSYGVTLSGNQLTIGIKNTSSVAVSATPNVSVLYMRTSL